MGAAADATGRALAVGEVGAWRRLTADDQRENERTVPEVFATVAAASPGAIAIEDGAGSVSYEELDVRSNRVASGLLGEAGAASAVGLIVGPTAEFLVALLGTLKAGRIAVPLDTRAPEAVLAATLSAARAGLVIGSSDGLSLPVQVRALGEYDREDDAAVDVAIDPGQGALLAFTSGSSGRPRGHLRSHRMLVHASRAHGGGSRIDPGARVAILGTVAIARAQPLRTLLNGATLLRYDATTDGAAGIAPWLAEKRAGIATIVPSMIDPLLARADDVGLPTLSALIVGGEKISRGRAEALRQVLPRAADLVYSYASTESARIACHPYSEPIHVDDSPLPVGFTLPGYSIFLRDEDGNPVESGEIVIESSYLARPWNPDDAGPFEPELQVRQTSDYGSVDDEGRLSVRGRLDRMVKVRGFRVELDAVERALLSLPGVRIAAAVGEPSPRGTDRLVAYVAVDDSAERSDALRRELGALLPSYAIPTRIVAREELPLLPGGKVDVKQLAATPREAATATPPQNDTEAELARIWASVLELGSVGRDEKFLELGGDSLSAAIVSAEVFKAFGVELTPRILDETPTVASMAAAIERLRAVPAARRRRALPGASRPGPFPIGVVQDIYWRYSLGPSTASYFNLAGATELRGDLDADALRRAVAEIVRRHDVLRTTIELRGKRPVQVVQPPPFLDWQAEDLRGFSDPTAEAAERFERERVTPFKAERDPPIRFRLWRTAEDAHELVRVASHTVFDSGSGPIFFRELAALYPSFRDGSESPLEDPVLQFGDYCLWQRARLRRHSRHFWQEIAWWRHQLTPPPERIRLPFARKAPAADAPLADATLKWQLPRPLSDGLTRLEGETSASYFLVRLAAFGAYLLEATARRDLVVGVQMTARQLPELNGMIGPLPNLMPLRLRIEGTPTFREWVAQVKNARADLGEHLAISYPAMPTAFRRVPVGVPAIDVMVGGNRTGPAFEGSPLPGLELRTIDRPAPPVSMHLKFSVSFRGAGDPEECNVQLDARKDDPALVREFLDGFATWAAERCEKPDAPLFGTR